MALRKVTAAECVRVFKEASVTGVRLTEGDVCGVLQRVSSFGRAHHTEADGRHRLLSEGRERKKTSHHAHNNTHTTTRTHKPPKTEKRPRLILRCLLNM